MPAIDQFTTAHPARALLRLWPCLVLCFYELVWETVCWLPATFVPKLCLLEHCAWFIFLGQDTQLLSSLFENTNSALGQCLE